MVVLPLIACLFGCVNARAALPSEGSSVMRVPASPDREAAAVRRRVEEARLKLGDQAGVPEEPDTYEPIPKDGRWLTPAEAQAAFAKALSHMERQRWWRIGLDPSQLRHTLREPAAVVSGCAAAYRAKLDGAERGLALAREAADFLLWAQAQGGAGLFPFPAARGGKGGKAFLAAEHAYAEAERRGVLDRMIRKGWAIDDLTTGGLQFDNGEAGVAMLELYELTRETKYLRSACQAADWAAAQPVAPNWNYNSFSVYLLAKAYAVTNDPAYLTAAIRKALIGVTPGQLPDGPRAGRWIDPHNAKPVYHYIMLRALAQLAAVMPKEDPARPVILRSLQLGLRARNQDFLGPGACDRNKAMEALLLVSRELRGEKELMRESLTAEALDALGKLTSDQYRSGKAPLGPCEWGLFLESVAGRARQ